jgi:hypothetical protein
MEILDHRDTETQRIAMNFNAEMTERGDGES